MLRKLTVGFVVLAMAVTITGCGDNKTINTAQSTTPTNKPEGPPKPPPIPPPPK